jgi:N-sulfoglucosamine sulfohydrolase
LQNSTNGWDPKSDAEVILSDPFQKDQSMKAIAQVLFALLVAQFPAVATQERPNILWITSEDNSSSWLGCYGNPQAVTPHLDSLASHGIRFTRAYSNGPVCAVARSTILNGAHAVTQGTHGMRSRHPIPANYQPHASYFRKLGYFCTNNSKTDYNFLGDDKAIWDECSGKAHYKNRASDQPFFAIFNFTSTHESQLFPASVAANRKRGIIPQYPRIDPAKVILPPYLPDLPEIRTDIAIYHDNITALDAQVGKALDDLKVAGLADDTIVIYCSDHGGAIPRGKRYLEDSGVRVPLLVYVPEKWRALSPFKSGQSVDEIVAFVDLAPTLLSLIGLDKPAQMQGRAFLGAKRVAPPEHPVAFLYADRFDETYGMRRAITDGRWKYIRTFSPHLPAAPYSHYQLDQPGWAAWQKAWKDGKLQKPFDDIWQAPQPVERLFDLSADPSEMDNLANKPIHAARLADLRERLRYEMIAAADLGVIPESMYLELAPGEPIASYLASRKEEIPALVSLAFTATAAKAEDLPRLISHFASPDPVTRYWAAQGCLILGKAAEPAAEALVKLLGDTSSAVRVAAGHALFILGRAEQGQAALVSELERASGEYAKINAMCALSEIGALDSITDEWLTRTLRDKDAGDLKRPANRILEERRLAK